MALMAAQSCFKLAHENAACHLAACRPSWLCHGHFPAPLRKAVSMQSSTLRRRQLQRGAPPHSHIKAQVARMREIL